MSETQSDFSSALVIMATTTTTTTATMIHSNSMSQTRYLNQRIVSFSPKKCFICLSVFEFNDPEYQTIKSYFLNKNLNLLHMNNKEKTMRILVLMNKFVLSICKCKKKLAHLECFNNYVDVKQNGNINIAIVCPQCNFEYDFEYPYNNLFLKTFDFFDQLVDLSSSLMTISACLASTYWSSLSYSIITYIQMYGFEEGIRRLRGLDKLTLFAVLPSLPIALVSARFIPWHDYFINLFPKYFMHSQDHLNRKQNQLEDSEQSIDEYEIKTDDQFIVSIRRIVGGLFLPTIAISLDRLCLKKLGLCDSVLVRTAIAGMAFIGVKGAVKFYLLHKRIGQQDNREIANYQHGN